MINLLPDETKLQLRAAHTNIILVKYMAILGIAFAFLALSCTASYLFLANNKAEKEKLEDNSQSTTFLYNIAQKKLSTIQTNLSTAKTILDHQISYSDIITGIAAAFPSGIKLDKLTIDSSTIGTPMTILARARSASNVPQIKDNFLKSSLFSNYNLNSVITDNSKSSEFPVIISISITINKGVAL